MWRILQKRRNAPLEESYTARLFNDGLPRIGQKIGEEGVETALAVALENREQFRYEAADLLYHLLVGLISLGMSPVEIFRELRLRHEKPLR